jgi:outer membrane protein assembly factor BamB
MVRGAERADFVNLLLDGDRVLAASKGEVYCLDGATGQVLWHNSLPGRGYGIVSMAMTGGTSSPVGEAAEHKRRQAQSDAVIAAS